MSGIPPIDRRNQIVIDPRFQRGVVRRLAVLVLGCLALFLGMAILMANFAVLSGGVAPGILAVLSQPRLLMLLVVLPLVVSLGWLFVFATRESLRIAGPHYRFQKVFQALAERRIPGGVQIRESDYLQDTCRCLDRGLQSLHQTLGEAQQQSADLAAHPQLPEDARELATQLQLTLGQFQLAPAGDVPAPLTKQVSRGARTPRIPDPSTR